MRLSHDAFRIEGALDGPEGRRKIAAAYERSSRRKKVEVNGVEMERLSAAIGMFGVVAFSLADVGLVSGPPAARRRFLDILLSRVRPGYLAALQRCRALVAQRNQALRRGVASAELEPWTAGLASAGATIMKVRAEWTDRRSEAFADYHRMISGSSEAALEYRPSVDALESSLAESDVSDWEARLREALEAAEVRERQQGRTLVGPHRDDLALNAPVADEAQRAIRRFGSGGQQRTAALALRLVEADTLRDEAGGEPVYLLDDVFAELDPQRSERLVALLEDACSGQVVLTAPKAADSPLGERLEGWKIDNGRLEA